jgi:hypothetical protein
MLQQLAGSSHEPCFSPSLPTLCAGLKPAPRKAPRKRGPNERKKKARKQMRMRNVTNVHLMDTGIFDGDAPTQID